MELHQQTEERISESEHTKEKNTFKEKKKTLVEIKRRKTYEKLSKLIIKIININIWIGCPLEFLNIYFRKILMTDQLWNTVSLKGM